jgi:hypothetical protein
VVGGHAQVGRALLDHAEQAEENPAHGTEWLVLALVEAAQAVELPEQLVRAVDEVNDQAELLMA